jgi:uncharacterized protein YlxW (UPF0749 family)
MKGVDSMRSEDKLLESYKKQEEVFLTSKQKKIENLQQRKEQISEKIKKLTLELNRTEEVLSRETQKEFIPFRDFQERAILQSKQTREKKTS